MKQSRHRIVVLEFAARDVQAQFDYIQQRSSTGAELWYEAYLDALERLKYDPIGPGRAPEDEHAVEDIRQVFFKTPRGRLYRVLYTVIGDEVRVLRVRGQGQDIVRSENLTQFGIVRHLALPRNPEGRARWIRRQIDRCPHSGRAT